MKMEGKKLADEIKDKVTFNYNMKIRDMMESIKQQISDLESNAKKFEIETYKLTGIISEEWRSIDGFMNYQVSNIGRVRNVITERILKPRLAGIGYQIVGLYKHGKVKNYYIHRLVAHEFLENPFELECVDHADGNKQNNCILNLRWCTPSQNQWNKKKQENTTSRFKGVDFQKRCNLWRARIRKDGNEYLLGYFKNEIDAAKVYNKHATEMFGDFKLLNVIPDATET